MTEQSTLVTATTPDGTSRLSFSDELATKAIQFADELFFTIPEVESVAIIPSYGMQNDRLPPGIIRGRNGPLQRAGELMRMGIQLHRTMKSQLDNLIQVIKVIDGHMAERTAHLKTLEETIREREQQLQQLTDPSGNNAGCRTDGATVTAANSG